MRRIFLKVFLLFLMSAVGLFLITNVILHLSRDDDDHHRPSLGRTFELGHKLVEHYEKYGIESLQLELIRLHERRRIDAFLLDHKGKPVGKPMPPYLSEYLENAPRFFRHNKKRLRDIGTVRIQSSQGNEYQFVVQYQRFSFHPLRGLPPGFGLVLLLLAVAIASALIAFVVTRPLARLKSTTAKFADGNFDARAPVRLSHRKDAFGELSREFDNMAKTIQSQMEGQRQLLRDVSHELRSPLARMQVAATLAEDRGGEDVREPLDRIHKEIHRLDQLIDQLISLNKSQSGVLALNKSRFDLVELLKSIAVDAGYEFSGENKRVVVETVEKLWIEADQDKLRSAFENIIRNGLRYTPNDTSVDIEIRRSEDYSSQIKVSVRDHGPGVPAQYLGRIFDPFFRPDESRSEKTGNSGIGLAIARAMIALHGGEISAKNRPSEGLEILVSLPATILDQEI